MLHVVKYKGCVRCNGDLFLESDPNGVYISCLQCGGSYARIPVILKGAGLKNRKRDAGTPATKLRARPLRLFPAP